MESREKGHRLEPLALVRGPLPPRFARRRTTIEPGVDWPYDDAEWRDAIVVLERGEIELVGACGQRCPLGPGAVIWLGGLPLLAIHNCGRDPAILVAIWRRVTKEQP